MLLELSLTGLLLIFGLVIPIISIVFQVRVGRTKDKSAIEARRTFALLSFIAFPVLLIFALVVTVVFATSSEGSGGFQFPFTGQLLWGSPFVVLLHGLICLGFAEET